MCLLLLLTVGPQEVDDKTSSTVKIAAVTLSYFVYSMHFTNKLNLRPGSVTGSNLSPNFGNILLSLCLRLNAFHKQAQ